MRPELIQTRSGGAVAVPHLSQYFGLWAHEEGRLQGLVELARSMDLSAHVAEGRPLVAEANAAQSIVIEGGVEAEWDRDSQLLLAGDVALIDLNGTLTKYGSSLGGVGSTVLARRDLARAVRSERARSIVLVIDSPGGTVAGTGDLADDVAAANLVKPVVAFVEDLAASAAFYVASQAGLVLMNPTGMVGAIGVFALVYDFSGALAQAGIKAYVMRAGALKGAGAMGTEITEAQRSEWQRAVDEMYEQFVGAVARGRGMDDAQARALADGRVWGAADALEKNLIDGVSTLAEAVQLARQEKTNRLMRAETKRRKGAMSFISSVKAVLAGKPAEAAEDHREIAVEVVEAVRAHDKPGHEAAMEQARHDTAVMRDKAEMDKIRAAAAEEASSAANSRAAEIVTIGAKLGLGAERTAAHIKSGESVDAVARKAIDESAAGGGVTAPSERQQSQPGDQTEDDAAYEKAAKAVAGRS